MVRRVKWDIFASAIVISAAMHLISISAIKVVVAPQGKGVVTFTQLSFLGPISERGGLQIGIEPREKSFLEKRCLSILNKEAYSLPSAPSTRPESPQVHSDKRLVALIEDALEAPKLEPSSIKE